MQNISPYVYHDDNYVFGRKSSGTPSTRGQEVSFLDGIEKNSDKIWSGQRHNFSREEEYGLLNRLDTPTSGLLLFARDAETKGRYKALEQAGSIQKIYYAQTYGRPRGSFGRITTPIYHHAQLNDRMSVDVLKGRNSQEATTYREYLEDDSEKAWLRIVITQGVRHQIRIHLASLGCPIVGDSLYMGSSLRKRFASDCDGSTIELMSAGVIITDNISTRK